MISTDVAIIGGGLAGIWTAQRLSQRRLSVTILEKEEHLGARASGNQSVLVMPYLGADPENLQFRFYRDSFDYAVARYHELSDEKGSMMTSDGVLQLPSTVRLSRIVKEDKIITHCSLCDSSCASQFAGITVTEQSIFVGRAGMVEPKRLLQRLLDACSPQVTVALSQDVVTVESIPASDWQLTTRKGSRVQAASVVFCAAFETSQWPQTESVGLEPVRGETLLIRANAGSKLLKIPISFDGYLMPALEGVHVLGAHYRHGDMNELPNDKFHPAILERLERWLPGLGFGMGDVVSARVCFRTSTPDRLPFVGQLEPDERKTGNNQPYVNCGHGSRGFVSCAVSAEIIARQVCGEPLGELAGVESMVRPQVDRLTWGTG